MPWRTHHGPRPTAGFSPSISMIVRRCLRKDMLVRREGPWKEISFARGGRWALSDLPYYRHHW